MDKILLSVCIPAYNRPNELKKLLQSLGGETLTSCEIVVSEDCSPRRPEIEDVVRAFARSRPDVTLRYLSNIATLGYDGNLRRLIDIAEGEYCVFMGDDDLLVPGALKLLQEAVRNTGVGVVLRAWRAVDKETLAILHEHRYFSGDRFFDAGPQTVAAFFRRSVFISGLTIRRDAAARAATSEYDGTLLYQLHLVGTILLRMNGFYLSSPIALNRQGGEHFFGSSDAERNRFEPGKLSPAHSLRFVEGLLRIAKGLDKAEVNKKLYDLILMDVSRSSLPLLAIQAKRLRKSEFAEYGRNLASLGLGRSTLFWAYYFGLLIGGPHVCEAAVGAWVRIIGRTPVLAGTDGRVVPPVR
jgi:glycosyltransferase involved in cell wall biosynthesis